MRKLLSRVENVFQIAGRGCVVAPGIPRNIESHVKIGDQLWLERPDGSERTTTVRGIEMGGPMDSPGIPILLGSDIAKQDAPIGTRLSIEFAPAGAFTLIARNPDTPIELDQIFQRDDGGHLRFGWSGKSRAPATTIDIENRPIEFADYLMEGFVTYHAHAMPHGDQLTVNVTLHGTNRDQYLPSHVTFHLEQAGLIMGD